LITSSGISLFAAMQPFPNVAKNLLVATSHVLPKTASEFIPDRKYQGWKAILHGGIIATLLDEAMTRLAWIACGGAANSRNDNSLCSSCRDWKTSKHPWRDYK